MQSEPGKAIKTKLKEGLEVTLWDRWEYDVKLGQKDSLTLKNVVEYLEKTYGLEVRDIFYGSIPLYMHALNLGKDRAIVLSKEPLVVQVHPALSPEARALINTIDLTITFVDPSVDKAKML
jgi:hypothetical protein